MNQIETCKNENNTLTNDIQLPGREYTVLGTNIKQLTLKCNVNTNQRPEDRQDGTDGSIPSRIKKAIVNILFLGIGI